MPPNPQSWNPVENTDDKYPNLYNTNPRNPTFTILNIRHLFFSTATFTSSHLSPKTHSPLPFASPLFLFKPPAFHLPKLKHDYNYPIERFCRSQTIPHGIAINAFSFIPRRLTYPLPLPSPQIVLLFSTIVNLPQSRKIRIPQTWRCRLGVLRENDNYRDKTFFIPSLSHSLSLSFPMASMESKLPTWKK